MFGALRKRKKSMRGIRRGRRYASPTLENKKNEIAITSKKMFNFYGKRQQKQRWEWYNIETKHFSLVFWQRKEIQGQKQRSICFPETSLRFNRQRRRHTFNKTARIKIIMLFEEVVTLSLSLSLSSCVEYVVLFIQEMRKFRQNNTGWKCSKSLNSLSHCTVSTVYS